MPHSPCLQFLRTQARQSQVGYASRTVARSLAIGLFAFLPLIPTPGWTLPLSPGDRIKLAIPEGDLFNGTYEVNLDGTIQIPFLDPLPVTGLEPSAVEKRVTEILVQKRLFNPRFVRASAQVVEWSPIHVFVSGATFQPGRVLINDRTNNQRNPATVQSQISGDYPPERFLAAALRTAGGLTPTADVRNIQLIRQGQTLFFDLSGILSGESTVDVPLVAGDRIVVPDTGRQNAELVRPSQITPAGVRVFLSNLTVPNTNTPNAAVSKESTPFTYGTRLSQAVIAANCAGGTKATNAKRRVVLVRTDRATGKTTGLDRSVEDLMRKSQDDAANPFLMPDDGVACYDSKTTGLRDVARTLGDVFSPFSLLLNIFR